MKARKHRYTRSGEAVRLQVDGDQRTEQILARDSAFTSDWARSDLNGLARATTSFSLTQTELSIFKSLEDQLLGDLERVNESAPTSSGR